MATPTQVGRRLGANLARATRRAVAARVMPRRAGVWVVVRISPSIGEESHRRGLTAREPSPGLLDVLEVLDRAATDPRVDGVLLRFRGAPVGWSKVHSLRRAVLHVRASGKPVAVYADSLDAAGLLLATAASAIWIPESGQVFLVGLRAEALFLRGLLDHLDVRAEIVRIGDYKSAAERLTRERMSAQEREQLEALVDDLFEELVSGIAAGRGLPPSEVRELIDRGPFHGRAAAEAGLIDGCLYPDEVEAELERLAPGPDASRSDNRGVKLVEATLYHRLRASDRGRRPLLAGLPHFAYVVAQGAIHRGRAARGIGAEGLGRLLERLRVRDDVRGVVLRINSPGGDATASDLLWRSVSLVAREKPVVASMGDVAASGGYFLASAAHAIFAELGTVTGSIGVVGGKLNLEGLYARIGVGKDAVERGARAGLLSDSRGFTGDERAAVREEMSALYEIFVDRVASGRGLSHESVKRAAGGRVWSGVRARSLGLVDSLGGPLEALHAVRIRAGLDSDDPFVLDHHPRVAPWARFESLLRWLPRLGSEW